MWKRLTLTAFAGALLDWATTAYGLSTGLFFESRVGYSPVAAFTLLPFLAALAFGVGRLCSPKIRLAYTILAFVISGSDYAGALNNVVLILGLVR